MYSYNAPITGLKMYFYLRCQKYIIITAINIKVLRCLSTFLFTNDSNLAGILYFGQNIVQTSHISSAQHPHGWGLPCWTGRSTKESSTSGVGLPVADFLFCLTAIIHPFRLGCGVLPEVQLLSRPRQWLPKVLACETKDQLGH